MSETESCENCKNVNRCGRYYFDCPFLLEKFALSAGGAIAPICKHYATPEPSEFDKAFHALSEKYPDDADYMMAAFMWRAGDRTYYSRPCSK